MQLGLTEDDEFENYIFEKPAPSLLNTWPTKENKNVGYKYTGFILQNSYDVNIIERQTYSSLDFLGDCGGLFDALRLIGGALVGGAASF